MFKQILHTPALLGLALIASALTTQAAETQATGKIAQAVAGKLVKAEGKRVASYAIKANPRYYVLYHSAGW